VLPYSKLRLHCPKQVSNYQLCSAWGNNRPTSKHKKCFARPDQLST